MDIHTPVFYWCSNFGIGMRPDRSTLLYRVALLERQIELAEAAATSQRRRVAKWQEELIKLVESTQGGGGLLMVDWVSLQTPYSLHPNTCSGHRYTVTREQLWPSRVPKKRRTRSFRR
jgi:hypothetical protein